MHCVSTHVVAYIMFLKMQTLMVSCYTLGVCLVVWMQYKLACENLANMFLLHLICIHL